MCQATEEYQSRNILERVNDLFVELQDLSAVHIQYTYQKALKQLQMQCHKSVLFICMTLTGLKKF
jgi:hypothetical protein